METKKKILAISGGTLNGSNDSMAKEALMGAQAEGVDIEFIHLLDLDLKPCTGCIACVNALMRGDNGFCIIKGDDFPWLYEKVMDADGLIFVMPIFEKGVPAVFHIFRDRMCGPANDTGMNIIAGKIAEKTGGTGPDPRKFKPKVMGGIGIGGSDWGTRLAADYLITAMSGMWKVINIEWIPWAKSVIIQDENVAKCRELGAQVARAAKDAENAKYLGTPGLCSVCQCRNFYIHDDGVAECVVCGVRGKLVDAGNNMRFDFDPEQLEHAHTTLPGKFKHMDDIRKYETQLVEDKKSPEFKARVQKYKDFIKRSRPEKV